MCFGIGRFSDCSIARHQLAYILSIQAKLKISNITFHEPVLSSGEVNILTTLNSKVCAQNLEGKVSVGPTERTLVYLPHCPKQLTNNFLWKNWSSAALQNLTLVCNSFANLIAATPSRFLDIDAAYIVKISQHVHEQKLRNTFKFTDIFNDTSVHTFATETLPQEFWSNPIEPKYSSEAIELITSELIERLSLN